MVLSLAGSSWAAAYDARVRWQPSSESGIAGYRVWVRPANGSYGAPRDAGMPSMDRDGSYSLLLNDLDSRSDYAIAVSAYIDAETESPRSNELQIGYAQVAPTVDTDGDGLRDSDEDRNLNRVVDAGETDPNRADSDGDGVGDATDRCSGSGAGAAVNAQGCSCAQVTCDDGNACNGVETCQAGVCRPGSTPSCDDGNPCTTDGCRAASGCTHTAVPSCNGCTTNAQCDDGNGCTTDVCNAGTCRNTPAADGTSCGDGNSCNGNETCQAGTCRAGTTLSCDDGNSCTTDTCNPGSGCAHAPIASCRACTTNAQCDDGNACNGAETCRAGTCAAGTPLSCDDGNNCTTDACSPQSGCTHAPDAVCGACPNATVFPAAGGTVTGTTTGGSASRFTLSCEGTTKTTADTVYAWTPAVSGTVTISTCGAATKFDTVVSLRQGTCDGTQDLTCNDDTIGCAAGDNTQNADHHGSRITTTVSAGKTYYIVVDGYNGKSGAFSLTVTAPTACSAATCDDGKACTTDTCNASGACVHTPIAGCEACTVNAHCDDRNACTSDVCTAGRCEHQNAADGTACADGNACNGTETCRAGQCTAGQAPSCDDGNTCTTDTCSASAGCSHTAVAGCTACSGDSQCNDGNACTTDSCRAGQCQHQNAADGASCGDGNMCNGSETCQAGRCAAGTTLSCDDRNDCTRDTCNAKSGCSHAAVAGCAACTTAADCDDHQACTADACVNGRCSSSPVANGASCTDGNFCNGLETCQAGRCAGGDKPSCDDGNGCTTDSCDSAAGQCTHTGQTACCKTDEDCADTDACTVHERCEAGACVTDPVECGAPGPCEEGVCDPVKGCATVALADGTACDDGDPCTEGERCSAGTCGAVSTEALTTSTGTDLKASAFTLKRSSKRVWKLSAEGSFTRGLNPINNGLTFAILEADGTTLYEAQIPASAFVWKKNRFYYKAGDSDSPYGVQKVEIKLADGGMEVALTAKVPSTVAVVPGMEELRRRHLLASETGRKLTWMISSGDRCVRDRTVTCPISKSSSKRCS